MTDEQSSRQKHLPGEIQEQPSPLRWTGWPSVSRASSHSFPPCGLRGRAELMLAVPGRRRPTNRLQPPPWLAERTASDGSTTWERNRSVGVSYSSLRVLCQRDSRALRSGPTSPEPAGWITCPIRRFAASGTTSSSPSAGLLVHGSLLRTPDGDVSLFFFFFSSVVCNPRCSAGSDAAHKFVSSTVLPVPWTSPLASSVDP